VTAAEAAARVALYKLGVELVEGRVTAAEAAARAALYKLRASYRPELRAARAARDV